jgi:hypothetical protein
MSILVVACGPQAAERAAQEDARQYQAKKAANEAAFIKRACEELHERWSEEDTRYRGTPENCEISMGASIAQNERDAKADRAQKDREIEALYAASCEIDPTQERC